MTLFIFFELHFFFYFYFINRSEYSEKSIPKHACLKLIANSEQELSALTSRRLLTFEKIAEPGVEHIYDTNEEITDFRLKYICRFRFNVNYISCIY